MVKTSLAVALALVVLACGTSNSQAPQFDPTTGKHPATWLATHFVAYNQNKTQCTPCHGSATDPASTGGTSGINCFFCHAQQTPPVTVQHPAGWSDPANHGATAKQAASLTAGFALCSSCHGAGYSTPVSNPGGPAFTCFTCHNTAPHPAAPWLGTTITHTNTDPSNVSECAKCHTAGNNSTLPFLTPAPAGTAPGCFNNTLCHGNIQGHNATWAQPTQHGLLGAMAAPNAAAAKGFLACQVCHGANYVEGPYRPCFACHNNAPHPDRGRWIGGVGRENINHGLTNQGNADACFVCHSGGRNSTLVPAVINTTSAPGCLNNTMCHDTNLN